MDWPAISAISGASVAALAILGFVIHKVRPKLKAVRQFWDHLVGVEANTITGQERIPGLFEVLKGVTENTGRIEGRLDERLDQQDGVLAAQDKVLETIRHEVEYNNGTSIKDSQRRTEKETKAQGERLEDIAKRLETHLAACPGAPQTIVHVNPGSTP